jgi:hypothetical protein
MACDRTMTLGLAALFLAPPVEAQILKCIDMEKNVTYSDVPCQRTEKMAIVDTRAATNVMDYSFIRSQKSRVFAPTPQLPSFSSSPSPPPPAPEPFVVDRSVKPATTY